MNKFKSDEKEILNMIETSIFKDNEPFMFFLCENEYKKDMYNYSIRVGRKKGFVETYRPTCFENFKKNIIDNILIPRGLNENNLIIKEITWHVGTFVYEMRIVYPVDE